MSKREIREIKKKKERADKQYALRLRKRYTPAERAVWELVRDGQLGLDFKREYRIGSYIVDFYCADKRLVIEIDGAVHFLPKKQARDSQEDSYMRRHDYTLVRFTNRDVKYELDWVIGRIKEHLEGKA